MSTLEKTYKFSEKYSNIKYKRLGKTGYQVSICGFGTYRVDYRIQEHAKTLAYALTNGINLVDTSSNYSDGGSEILVGNVVNGLMENEGLERDEVVIVSKGGYIQGENQEIAKERETLGTPYPEVVRCAPDLWHCIHPEFLQDQITASLERLKLGYIDVYLLHNPEYFLMYTGTRDVEKLREEYYRRIKNAFIYLEEEVAKGRILHYGISSNSFGEENDKRSFTSLEEVLRLSKEISPENHFSVVQLPLNLLEKGGAENLNQEKGKKTFLELASENDLGVLVNRPLNAIKGNKIVRLADFSVKEDRTVPEINQLIGDLKKQEDSIKASYVTDLSIEAKDKQTIIESMSLASVLENTFGKFESANQFIEIKKQFFIPRANYAINEIYKHYDSEEDVISKLNYYATTVNIVLDSMESIFAKESNSKNRKVHEMIAPYLNGSADDLSLSQKAILMINSLPNVTSTLVGMRTQKYVDDVIGSIETSYALKAGDFWKDELKD
ncbi:MAG: aldo/keto reductase [Ignavibacteria bacterium]|jgi:aryl-alcohol dehydrogenase-like predicted oxidoreductase|nr:aldo/keto reductase [Ignavibacteria bacterium]MCU7500472.1 aldo/keto reductase [Ignavibacteria bacterium]MCU7520975.1 aldo/keto reductase [Ignavibacteria bacterium]MCU7525076.1 aldo/keto reductase [Ignavibacteria bacterium]